MKKVYSAPSREIGEREGLDFLWNDWGIADHASIQDSLLDGPIETAKTLQSVTWDYILDKEPRFADMSHHEWWIIMGVVSQYNYDDILYFCEHPYWYRNPEIYQAQVNLGWGGNGWIISPTTLEKVKLVMEEVT